MFSLAILIGIYSYLILATGLAGILTKVVILSVTLVYFLGIVFYFRNLWRSFFESASRRITYIRFFNFVKKEPLAGLSLVLLIILSLVNLIGTLGPELAFDALWYHLTLPKLYLLAKQIHFIRGGLLYYSAMPRLTEMLYTASLALEGQTMAKLLHFGFGLLSCIAVYTLARVFFNKKISILAVLLFYSNLVVDWESITAYIDLARTFFETASLVGFFYYLKKQERKWLLVSAVMLGLAICTKTLSMGSLLIYSLLLLIEGMDTKKSILKIWSNILVFNLSAIVIVLPWFSFAYFNTGNPFYPLFTNYNTHQTIAVVASPVRFMQSLWNLFTASPDPLSPFYIIVFPLLFFKRSKISTKWRYLVVYCITALFIWYVTPQSGGGRFILPYLPSLSVLSLSILLYRYPLFVKNILIGLLVLISVISILYRGVANEKYLPIILGFESKDHFLTNHLNFSFGDFYDTDHFLTSHIKASERVLLYGFHNLYYVDFPFIDSSWINKGDRFDYIAIQGGDIPPRRFKNWQLYYVNKKTNLSVYTYHHHQWIY